MNPSNRKTDQLAFTVMTISGSAAALQTILFFCVRRSRNLDSSKRISNRIAATMTARAAILYDEEEPRTNAKHLVFLF